MIEDRGALPETAGHDDRPPPDDDRDTPPRERRAGARERWPFWLPLAVLILGLVVTGVLTWASRSAYLNNEKRLLRLRVREAGSVLSEALPSLQTPLASAAELANATGGDVRKFRQFMVTYVGSPPAHPFIAASLWRLPATGHGPVTSLGAAQSLSGSSPRAKAFFARTARVRSLGVIGMLTGADRRLGYAFATPRSTGGYAAYAEAALPRSRRSTIQSDSAFSDLNYALYLGRSQRARDLLVTSEARLPIRGTRMTETVPFGDNALTLVMTPRRPLGGPLTQELPWIILAAGVVLSLGATALVVGLTRRRRAAERLAARLERVAGENRRLYAEQRNIAQTLQHALLPYELPSVPGAEAAARFEPGERGVDIGGDWYDVIVRGDRQLLLVVGDVSGRGLRAAATMASLRYAIHAYAAEGDPPASILTKLSSLVSIGSGGRLATVLCATIDLSAHSVTLTSAGHLPPLLISHGHSEYVESAIGLPVGVDPDASYESTMVTVPPGATFLAYTDGLIERRGENLDQGLARLRAAATGRHADLPELLTQLLDDMRHGPIEDDTAILGLRWTE